VSIVKYSNFKILQDNVLSEPFVMNVSHIAQYLLNKFKFLKPIIKQLSLRMQRSFGIMVYPINL